MKNMIKTTIIASIIGLSAVAQADELIVVTRGTTQQAVEKDINGFVEASFSQSHSFRGDKALVFQIHNWTGYDLYKVKAKCRLEFDPNQRFVLQKEATPPAEFEVYLQNGREQTYTFWHDVKDYGTFKYYSNATIENVDCKVVSYELHRPSQGFFDFSTQVAVITR